MNTLHPLGFYNSTLHLPHTAARKINFFSPNILCLLTAVFLYSGLAHSEDSAEACFNAKDKSCLESMYRDILDNPTQEKKDAIHYLGLLYLEEEDYEAAKDQFEIGTMFGDKERNAIKLEEIIGSGKIELHPVDCLASRDEECFLNVAKNNPEKAGPAYYLLTGVISATDPDRATQYTLKAAELGHVTAACQLGSGYAHEPLKGPSVLSGFVPSLPVDFEKSRQWYEVCGNGPFPGYSEEYFQKYLGDKDNKAFVKSNNVRFYQSGAATPELAAQIAYGICINHPKNKSENNCLVVSINGEWVDYYKPEPIPERVGGVEDLTTISAREGYPKFEKKQNPKVFAQGPLGNWSWVSRSSDKSIEEVKQIAIESCQKTWRYEKYGSACSAININGEWVK